MEKYKKGVNLSVMVEAVRYRVPECEQWKQNKVGNDFTKRGNLKEEN